MADTQTADDLTHAAGLKQPGRRAGHRVCAFRRQSSQPGPELAAYPFSQDAVSDALTVADQTTGVHGESMVPEERMRDMLERRVPGRVAQRLDSIGVHTALPAGAA
jgi:hypothetical protein